jgi:hypothetical protein
MRRPTVQGCGVAAPVEGGGSMSRSRLFAPTATAVVGAGAALFAALQPVASVGQAEGVPPSWWQPPADVRAMLQDVSADSLERYDAGLVRFRDPPHALDAGRPESRHRRGARLDQERVRQDRGDVGRTHDRRAAELHPAARAARPDADQDHQCDGVLNMDIIGSPDGGNGFREPRVIRLSTSACRPPRRPADKPLAVAGR